MSAEYKNVFEIISREYYSFTVSEKKLADFMLSTQDTLAYLSISQLADGAGVAEATVSRFCRRLGFANYAAFKLTAANTSLRFKPANNPLSGQIEQTDSVSDICRKLYTAEIEAIGQTMDVLDETAIIRAADLLEKAPRVLCMGQGGSMLIAQEAAHLFSTVDNHFIPVIDSHLQAMAAAMMDPDDVILFFSYSGSTRAMMETLSLAKKQQGKVILVTRFPNSPGGAISDIVLQCGANENPLQSGSIAARIAQMYLLDVLFSEYSRRNLIKTRYNRGRIADALVDKHL
ncbi:MAG: MurR/RpiR family transcriptional regulator [Oscillospiraceae bacterium]|nr:MurR/RpiR family transcriptional regulator [Oscillospiraceae bacterium]